MIAFYILGMKYDGGFGSTSHTKNIRTNTHTILYIYEIRREKKMMNTKLITNKKKRAYTHIYIYIEIKLCAMDYCLV